MKLEYNKDLEENFNRFYINLYTKVFLTLLSFNTNDFIDFHVQKHFNQPKLIIKFRIKDFVQKKIYYKLVVWYIKKYIYQNHNQNIINLSVSY